MTGAKSDDLTGPLYGYMKKMAKTPAYRAKHGHNRRPMGARRTAGAQSVIRGGEAAAARGTQTIATTRGATVRNRTVDATVNPVLAARTAGRAAVQAARATGDQSAVLAAKQARRADVKDAKAYRATFTGQQARTARKQFRSAGGRSLLKGRTGIF